VPIGIASGGFHEQVDVEAAPVDALRRALMEDLDLLALDAEALITDVDGAGKAARSRQRRMRP